MGYSAQRRQFSLGRGWTLLLLVVGLLVAASFWIGPLRPLPAELELLAITGDMAVPDVHVAGAVTENGLVRFAVPVAVRNAGARAARPRRLMLSVPARYRLALTRGRLVGQVTPGVPLRRYEIDLAAPVLEPGAVTVRLPTLDTLWLEPDLPRYYCTLTDGRVPEFEPAPPYDPATLADVRIFYSFVSDVADERSTGVLTVHVDSSLLQVQPAPRPPLFPVVFHEGVGGLPDLGALHVTGTRTAWCGDPEQPVELLTMIWGNAAGSRALVVHVDGRPRKHLYDVNGDGIVELETWDADGDEHFEARREARFAIPEFLLPLPPRNPELLRPDSIPPDGAWLAVFNDRSQGPWRFARYILQTRADSIAGERTRADSLARLAADTLPAAPAVVAMPGLATAGDSAAIAGVTLPTQEWLRLFNNTAAGPFRFSQRAAAAAPPRAAPPATAVAANPDTTPARTDTAVAEPEPPRRRREPLGIPVELLRRDTTRTQSSD
ncbi:MAG: hypothetical protein WEF86_12780 [Gemmatimonadota bacterium]